MALGKFVIGTIDNGADKDEVALTAENITTALGFTPANNTSLTTLDQRVTTHTASNNASAHTIANVTGLQPSLNAIDQKIITHTASGATSAHTIPNIAGLQSALNSKMTAPTKTDGNPEGVVNADVGMFYTDTATGELFYKQTGVGNTGWKKVALSEPIEPSQPS